MSSAQVLGVLVHVLAAAGERRLVIDDNRKFRSALVEAMLAQAVRAS